VTIIAGFRTYEGIVICGDTQETVAGLSKRHVAKVKVEPYSLDLPSGSFKVYGQGPMAACFCGAGEGPFIDKLTHALWEEINGCTSIDDGVSVAGDTIKDFYKEYGAIYQTGMCPSVELIYGIKLDQDSRMFRASGPMVNEVPDYCSAGTGYYMADFLTSRMNHALDLHQCVILAAYILFQAKEHVDGCGGDSHIGVLRHKGKSGLVDHSRVEAITKLVERMDRRISEVLIASADLRETRKISDELKELLAAIKWGRGEARKEIQDADRRSSYGPAEGRFRFYD